jgi:four helix bundle protein
MSRDPWKLKVFVLADRLVLDVYRATRGFPADEWFGLQSQIRRASVSVTTNIVEGCARRTLRDYLHFMGISLASASETRYLLDLSRRLEFLSEELGHDLLARYGDVVRGMQTLVETLRRRSSAPRHPPDA